MITVMRLQKKNMIMIMEEGGLQETEEESTTMADIDPHYWLDPERAKQMAENMKNTLVELDPDNKATYEDNYTAVAKELDELDQKFQQAVEGKDNKKIIVSPCDLWILGGPLWYRTDCYNWSSPTNEPSQKELEKSSILQKIIN